MAHLPCRVLVLALAALCFTVVFAQQPGAANAPMRLTAYESTSSFDIDAAPVSAAAIRPQYNPSPMEGPWLFSQYGIGTYTSPLGFGGRVAASLTRSLNLRAGASYFSFGITRSVSNIPFSANVKLQSEQASVDWYPFHSSFHLSPGVMFGSSNRAYGNASITAGNSFTLNNVTYYSAASSPVKATGAVMFAHTAPMFTVGWGNWVRGESQRHFAFPFEMGFAYEGSPMTALNFTGVACTDAGQSNCENISADPSILANIAVEQKKLQDDADWLRFYPIVAGGVVYRF